MATQINAGDRIPRRSQRREENRTPEPASTVAKQNTSQPSEEDVASLAYQLWLGRGCPIGEPEQDWYKAEEVIREQTHVDAAA